MDINLHYILLLLLIIKHNEIHLVVLTRTTYVKHKQAKSKIDGMLDRSFWA